jgi:hypothetical protein
LSKKDKANHRNKFFDCIVSSGFFYYAVLLIDDFEIPLFCGEVGEIKDVMIDKKDKDSYLLTFDLALYEDIITIISFEVKNVL